MCLPITPRNEHEETFGVSKSLHEGPCCEDCGEPTTEHGVCPDCVELRRELEADDVWPVWLESLEGGAEDMDALDDKLAGWKYVGGDIRHGKSSKGVYIDSADKLHFMAPGHRGHVFFVRGDNGWPVVHVVFGDPKCPDWAATFSACTPHEIILTACNAVIYPKQ
jgi:hypothetical protein